LTFDFQLLTLLLPATAALSIAYRIEMRPWVQLGVVREFFR